MHYCPENEPIGCNTTDKCPQDYIGDYCQFYAGFYSATIGLVIGLFVTLLIILLAIVFIWYCCARKKRRKQESQQVERLPSRTCLSNRINRNDMIYGMIDVTPYTSHANLASTQIRGYSTSQSCSVYENVGWGEDIEPAKFIFTVPSSVYIYEKGESPNLLDFVNTNKSDDKQKSISISEYGLITDRSTTSTSIIPIHREVMT
ncbi:unnamed protein product [Heterobilharzia americana]|nr:unnamed protein product [Heterobilharzia americana]